MKFSAIVLGVILAGSVPGARLCAQEEDPSPSENFSEYQPEPAMQDADSLLSVPYLSHRGSTLKWYSMFTNIPGDWFLTVHPLRRSPVCEQPVPPGGGRKNDDRDCRRICALRVRG